MGCAPRVLLGLLVDNLHGRNQSKISWLSTLALLSVLLQDSHAPANDFQKARWNRPSKEGHLRAGSSLHRLPLLPLPLALHILALRLTSWIGAWKHEY